MKAYFGMVDETGLRVLLPDDERPCLPPLAGSRSWWIWAAVPAEGVPDIEADLRSGRRVAALGLLHSLAVELIPAEHVARG